VADIFTQFFKQYKNAAVALSGGADSACVLMLAVRYMGAENVTAYTCTNSHVFRYEIENAEKIAKTLGVEHRELSGEMPAEFYAGGDDRCYHCKRSIMVSLTENSEYDAVFDGTNADDDPKDRPGFRAIDELGIISPLRALGLGKDFVNEEVKKLEGVSFHSDSCKATRLNGQIDSRRMDLVEKIEDALRETLPGMRYRVDEGFVLLKKPLKIYQKDFEKINEIKRNIGTTA